MNQYLYNQTIKAWLTDGRGYDRLAKVFGHDAIFKDVNSTLIGLDYSEYQNIMD